MEAKQWIKIIGKVMLWSIGLKIILRKYNKLTERRYIVIYLKRSYSQRKRNYIQRCFINEYLKMEHNKILNIILAIEEENVPELKEDMDSKVKQFMKCWLKIIERKMTIETCTWKGVSKSHVEWVNLDAFLPSNVHAKSLHSCPTLWDLMDCGPLGSSVHGIRLDWVAMPSSKASSQTRNWIHVIYVSCIVSLVLYHWYHLGSPLPSRSLCKYYNMYYENENLIHSWTLRKKGKFLCHFTQENLNESLL